MDAWPWLRERAMGLLSAQPQLFAHLLAVHLGERSPEIFCFGTYLPGSLRPCGEQWLSGRIIEQLWLSSSSQLLVSPARWHGTEQGRA
jgi:hypothetical protein